MANVYRTYVFKVAINCCTSCPRKLKNGLLSIEGIKSVDVNPEKKLVVVETQLDPKIIIEKIKGWRKTAKLLREEENNPHAYKVEIHDDDDDDDEENVREGSFFHSCFRTSSSKDSSSRRRCKTKTSHTPEKYEAQRNVSSPKEFPEHICRDKYCTVHKRESTLSDRLQNMDYQPMFRGGANHSHPIRNSYVPPPPPPHPPPQYRQYGFQPPPQYRQYGVVPPVVGYGGGYTTQRQMPRHRADGSADYEYSNGCMTM